MSVLVRTAESVTSGHPDKVCDQISDGILDACVAEDPKARVAVETMISGNTVFLAGELTTSARVDVVAVARRVIAGIGYIDPALGFDAASCFVLTDIRSQSPDIAQGVSRGEDDLGAGDQGVFYGYACDETRSLMPAPADLAHRLSAALDDARHAGRLPWARPDGKTQVTLRGGEDGRPPYLDSVIISVQHEPDVARETLIRDVLQEVAMPVLGSLLTRDTRMLINPTGRFVSGGPVADTGLTGRKLMVDTYGGLARHGGGAFSGKDATKVDRTAAYMGRYIAKTIVAAGLARRCEVSLAFAIGQREPEMVAVDAFGTETVDVNRLERAVAALFPLSVSGMIKALNLHRPVFLKTASHGHFGREDEDGFQWEKTDRVDALRAECRA